MAETTITHCIFDMDGLLLDTERIYTEATQAFLDKYKPGAKFTWDLKWKMMGLNAQESAKVIIEALELPFTTDEYIAISIRTQNEMFSKTSLLPGAERLIRHLHSHHIPISVATSSNRARFVQKTSLHKDLFSLFPPNNIICGDDPIVKRGKPDPDIFLATLARFEQPVAAESCLVFEDAVYGVEAAKRAGMKCVWVPDENLKELLVKEGGLERFGAIEVLGSLEEFKPKKYGLPSFESSS